MADRFVVRSVTGAKIDPAKWYRGMVLGTAYNVLDSLDCYRIVFDPSPLGGSRRFLCEKEAKRLNAEHEARS